MFTDSSVDEAAKEKLAPFSSLTDDESYASRDLEKVWHSNLSVIHYSFWECEIFLVN